MLRSYRYAILALVGCLNVVSGAAAQNNTAAPSYNEKVNSAANGSADGQNGNAANAIAPADIRNRENTVESDCGTPKECRAEQREKDDLVAQQTAAEAAVSQRNAAWWQTGVGAAGVILLILTVIYTHHATRAAINSVNIVAIVEGPRPNVLHGAGYCRSDGVNTTFDLDLYNSGRTMGTLKESCLQGSHSGLFKDFRPERVKRHNTGMPPNGTSAVDKLVFPKAEYKYIVGYYKVQSLFSKKLITDYFCFEIEEPTGPVDETGKIVGNCGIKYIIDRDWPADESV